MRTFAFEDIDVGDGWTASFHVFEDAGIMSIRGLWAAHADGRTIIRLESVASATNRNNETTKACLDGVTQVALQISGWCDDNIPTTERAESLSSKLRVERDLRSRMKGETK